MTKVRKRSAVLIFFAFVAFFTFNPPVNSEICNNAIDDNHDGLVDCQDPACQKMEEFCASSKEEKAPE